MIKIAAGNFTIPHALYLKKFIARNAETAARKVDYKKTDIYEGQIMITRDNISSIENLKLRAGLCVRQLLNGLKTDFLQKSVYWTVCKMGSCFAGIFES